MPEIQIRSYQQPKKDTPPGPAPDGGRHEATPTQTLPLSANFFPSYFELLESHFLGPEIFRRCELSPSTQMEMERKFKVYQRGNIGVLGEIRLTPDEAQALIVLAENPSIYKQPSNGIQSMEELKQHLADMSKGQAGPGTSL